MIREQIADIYEYNANLVCETKNCPEDKTCEECTADSIIILIRQEIEKIDNPTETGDKPFNKSRYEGFEQARQAILERLK